MARRGIELQAAIEPPGRLGVFVAQDMRGLLVSAGVLLQVPDHGIMPDQVTVELGADYGLDLGRKVRAELRVVSGALADPREQIGITRLRQQGPIFFKIGLNEARRLRLDRPGNGIAVFDRAPRHENLTDQAPAGLVA